MSEDVVADQRTREEKLSLFRGLFTGLGNVYGTYDPDTGRTWQVKAPVTDQVILDHLMGRKPYGVYLLGVDRTRAAAADFDDNHAGPPSEFVARAAHYGVPAYIERSKSKGFHVWVFFAGQGVLASKARLVLRHILDEMDAAATELFPKQDVLRPGCNAYGNFINAPLFGRLVEAGRTVFVRPENPRRPYANQWEFLARVERVAEDVLDDVIEVNALGAQGKGQSQTAGSPGTHSALFALPPCARRMLDEGVTADQRVACFRLAVHLRKTGLPFDITVAALSEWAAKNRPGQGKGTITEREIKAQTASAFLKEYKGCGCEEPAMTAYCSTACPVRHCT